MNHDSMSKVESNIKSNDHRVKLRVMTSGKVESNDLRVDSKFAMMNDLNATILKALKDITCTCTNSL